MRNEVNRAHKAKTTLRYLLSLIAILSVVSVSAATYGTTYQRQYNRQTRGVRYENTCTQMPTLSMSTMNASMMKSGSALPMAAVSGTTTADDNAPARSSRPRRVGEDEGFEGGDDPDVPENPFPLGDAVLPLMLMAMLFAGVIAVRKKRAVKVNG
jgi:hypothetical protein